MFTGSERCISTTLWRSKRRLQARRNKRLGRIADSLRLMTRAFKCFFSTNGKFEPVPFYSSRTASPGEGPRLFHCDRAALSLTVSAIGPRRPFSALSACLRRTRPCATTPDGQAFSYPSRRSAQAF
jgi:hypothetical protein